jgi:hypothetical protein
MRPDIGAVSGIDIQIVVTLKFISAGVGTPDTTRIIFFSQLITQIDRNAQVHASVDYFSNHHRVAGRRGATPVPADQELSAWSQFRRDVPHKNANARKINAIIILADYTKLQSVYVVKNRHGLAIVGNKLITIRANAR